MSENPAIKYLSDEDNALLESIRADAELHILNIKRCQDILKQAAQAEIELAKSVGAMDALDKQLSQIVKGFERKYGVPEGEQWTWNRAEKAFAPVPANVEAPK